MSNPYQIIVTIRNSNPDVNPIEAYRLDELPQAIWDTVNAMIGANPEITVDVDVQEVKK